MAAIITCHSCKGTDFWERPPHHGGGMVCSRCHPDPRKPVLPAAEYDEDLLPPERRRVLEYGRAHDWPEFQVYKWMHIIGQSWAWRAWVLGATMTDIEATQRVIESQEVG